jgi:hypothetical protein
MAVTAFILEREFFICKARDEAEETVYDISVTTQNDKL